MAIAGFDICQVGVVERHAKLMIANPLQIHAEEQKQVAKPDVINGADAIQLVDARRCLRILDLRKPCVGDIKLFVSLKPSDALAPFGHIPRGHPQA